MTRENIDAAYDRWLKTDRGQYIFNRQSKLIADLSAPVIGEKVLCVGCGGGHFLRLFQAKKCLVTGLDDSDAHLQQVRQRLGHAVELVRGKPEDLPFPDNDFDIVALIFTLGFCDDPETVINEAIRVSHRRVVIGFLNHFSFAGTRQSIKRLLGFPSSDPLRLFNVFEMKTKLARLVDTPSIEWGSVIYFPSVFYDWFSEMDEMFPRYHNPFGAFAGMVFPVKYILRTLQHPVLNDLKLKAEASAPAPEAVRSMLRGGKR